MSAERPTAGSPEDANRPPVERRRTLRVEASNVEVTLEIGKQIAVAEVRDVSRGGLRVRASYPPVTGDKVIVRHAAAGTLTGVCVRQTGKEIAIAFDPAESEVERTLQCLALLLAPDAKDADVRGTEAEGAKSRAASS